MKYILLALIAALTFELTFAAGQIKQTVRITGSSNNGDTVTIMLWDHYFGGNKAYNYKFRKKIAVATAGSYSFDFDSITGPIYFNMAARNGRKSYILLNLIAQPGDSIHFSQENYTKLNASGRNAEGIQCRLAMDEAGLQVSKTFYKQTYTYNYFKTDQYLLFLQTEYYRLDTGIQKRFEVLKRYKPVLSDIVYQLLEADLIGMQNYNKYTLYRTAISNLRSNMAHDSLNRIKSELDRFFQENTQIPKTAIPDETLSLSKMYVNAVTALTNVEAKLNPVRPAYTLIKERYTGKLRDQLLTVYLFDFASSIKSIESAMKQSLQVIETGYLKEAINYFLSNFLKGSTAYNFELEDTAGKTRKLSDFKGKKVVIDFWFTGCEGCIQSYKGGLREVEEIYKNDTSVVFISIANDANKSVWHKSILSGKYTSPAIINLIAPVSAARHPALEAYNVYAFPTLVIVNESGKISYNGYAPRNKEEILSLIQKN